MLHIKIKKLVFILATSTILYAIIFYQIYSIANFKVIYMHMVTMQGEIISKMTYILLQMELQ